MRVQAREQQASGEDVQVVLGYEAGYDGFWLQRRLAHEGVTCWVMDPGSLQVDRRACCAKTDRLDAAMLLRALMAWCRGAWRPAAWSRCRRWSARMHAEPIASASGSSPSECST